MHERRARPRAANLCQLPRKFGARRARGGGDSQFANSQLEQQFIQIIQTAPGRARAARVQVQGQRKRKRLGRARVAGLSDYYLAGWQWGAFGRANQARVCAR